MIHPRIGHSDKVSKLSDLEYRVWIQTLLSADDFGVLRFSVITLQADNDALAAKHGKAIEKALNALAKCGLLAIFEHQGRRYACHPQWQVYQKVEYPRETIQPKPTPDVFGRLEPKTQELFHLWPKPPRRPRGDKSSDELRTIPEPFPNGSQTDSNLARARPRETATAMAKANGSDARDDGEGERLWERWRTLMASRVRLPLTPSQNDAEHLFKACQRVPDEPRRMAALERFVGLNEADRRRLNVKSATLGYFVMALPDLVDGGRTYQCLRGHAGGCKDDAECTRRYMESMRAS